MDQMNFILFVALAASAFWICLAAWRGLLLLRKMHAVTLVALLALSGVLAVIGDKTNGIMRAIGQLRSPAPVAVTVTPDDIARGWRIESVSTNEAMSYGMPTNAVYVGNWHIHGARSSLGNHKVNFGSPGATSPAGWSFPLGTNSDSFSSFWYFVDGRIRPTPRDAAREIRAAGGPMFAAPGLSRLWAAAESDGSRVLTWENLFVGNDTNTPVNAQIRLCANGDFTTCSNAVVTICRRLHPSDWDGDGIPNLKDANPTICDGDFFGSQGEMPTNANPSAYCTVDIVVSSHVAEVVFSGDSPSNLPDPHFMARAGETNSVTILKGKTYHVSSESPFSCVGTSDPATEFFAGDGNTMTIRRPVSISCQAYDYQMRSLPPRRDGQGDSFSITVEPSDLGGAFHWSSNSCCLVTGSGCVFSYSCDGTCNCGGCQAGGSYGYEGYSLLFLAASCPCGSGDPQSGGPEDPSRPASVSISFSEDALFYEEAYTNSPGDAVGRMVSTNATLACSVYGGPYGGTFQVAAEGFCKLVRTGGDELPAGSVCVAPQSTAELEVQYEPLSHSASARDVKAIAAFSEYFTCDTIVSTAELTVVKLELTPDDLRVGFPHRHKVGVRESIRYEACPNVVEWSESGGGEFSGSGGFRRYCCPIVDDGSMLSCQLGRSKYNFSLTVVEPNGIVARSPVAFDFLIPTNHAGGAGMKLELFVQPETVSFSGIVMEEVPSSTGIHQGYFSNVFFTEEWCHTTEFGAGVWRNIRPDNYCGDDNATRGDELPREMPDGTMVFDLNAGTWSDGLMSWDIPWGWAERGCPDNGVPVKTLATQYNQVFQFSADGTLSVAKFGNVVSRGTNNVFRLNGVVANGHPYLEVYSAIEGE